MFDQLFRNMTPVVKNLLIINVIVFIANALLSSKGFVLNNYLCMYHYTSEDFQPYQIFTSMFAHGSLMHIFANMLGLVSFGTALEEEIGSKKFFILYMFAGVLGGLVYIGFHMGQLLFVGESLMIGATDIIDYGTSFSFRYTEALNNVTANKDLVNEIIFSRVLGASGAVFGVFAAVYKYHPNTEVMLMFPPIPLKIKILFSILMVGSLVLSIFPFAMQGVAHMAHFGGGLAGLILVYFWQKNRNTFY